MKVSYKKLSVTKAYRIYDLKIIIKVLPKWKFALCDWYLLNNSK